MSVPTFGTPKTRVEVPRGDGGKPLIRVAPGSDDLVEYARASSYGKAIDNGFGLTYWAKCMVVKGTAMSPSIVKAAKPLEYYGGDKGKLYELAEKAMTLAGSSDKATEGTAMHSYTELIDQGRELPKNIDPETLADLDAYRRVTDGLEHVAVERFVVVDELRAAGTFDRLVRVPAADPWPAWLHGRLCIADLKSGNVDGGISGIAVQLALYAHGSYYDPDTGERTATGADQQIGLVIHLPLGEATASIIAVDLTVGWEGALAAQAAAAFQAKARLGCKACNEGSGFYKNGRPCKSCKGVARVPVGVTVRAA